MKLVVAVIRPERDGEAPAELRSVERAIQS